MVVLKVDGLPGWLVERMLTERHGAAQLPWIERVFVERGVWVRNFYSRGVSLSVPSWAILDTGRPMVIHGNVEFDRYTLRAFDYLNFFPLYLKAAFSQAADMPGVEALDDLGVPLISDRFGRSGTRQTFQLFQRGIPWKTLKRAVRRPFSFASPRHFIGDWEAGFQLSRALQDEMERTLIRNLADENIRYLDLYTGEFDHVGHLDNSEEAQQAVVERLDAVVGRVWSAIEKSSLADQTILALVSDHGMNTTPDVYSQGYNLVDLFRSPAGGGHHVVTNRHPLADYKLKGLYPFVHKVLTSSDASPYDNVSAQDYPTVLLDLDGNERAAIYLRNSDLNKIHLLLLELERKDLAPELREAAATACRRAIEDYAKQARRRAERMAPELDALEEQTAALEASMRDLEEGIRRRRAEARRRSWTVDASDYRETFAALESLFSATPGDRKTRAKVMPKRYLGEPNSIRQLQGYVVSIAPGGLKLGPDGALDEASSFQRIDYFQRLRDQQVRNTVQDGLGRRPIDFVAVRVPAEALAASLPPEDAPDVAVWLSGGAGRQLLVLARGEPAALRVLPIDNLREHEDGRTTFERRKWAPGLPLGLFEDEAFAVAASEREGWLEQWQAERDWLRASHRTRYGNAVVGLFEQFRPPPPRAQEDFHYARRELLQPDLLVLANDHWNFNVRGFNPGGNHGGFFRISTQSVLMLAGGEATGVRRGVTVDEPYDALSFAPTVLRLMGYCDDGFPGDPIREAGDVACEPLAPGSLAQGTDRRAVQVGQ